MAITHMLPEGEVQPLRGSSANDNWPAAVGAEPRAEFPPELIERKLRSLLNRLTAHNFPSISQQIVDWTNRSATQHDSQSLRKLAQLILQQLTDCGPRPRLCASLCLELIQLSNGLKCEIDGVSHSGGWLFRHLLDRACKEEFQKRVFCEQVEKIADDQVLATAGADGQEDPHTQGEDVTVAERFYAAQKAKRQRLALVQFMGELFKVGMLAQTTLFELIGKLFSNINPPDEKFIECFCCLMMIVGGLLDKERMRQIATYFSRIESLCSDPRFTLRARFMFQNLIEARQNNWVERGANNDTEPAVQPPQTTPSSPPHTVPFDTKNCTTVLKLKDKQKKFFLQCLLEQRRLGFQTRDGSFMMQGWTNVAKRMNKQYNKDFGREWLTDQFNQLRSTYLDATAVLGLPGFKWRKHNVKADSPTWKRLLEANPDKRGDYELLRQIQFKWYSVAEQLFKGTILTPVKLPAAHVKPQIKKLEPAGWDIHVQPPASTSPNQLQDNSTGARGDSNWMDHAEPGARHDTVSIPTSAIPQGQEGLSRPIATAALEKKKEDAIQLNTKHTKFLLQSLLQQRCLGFQTDDGNFQTDVWAHVSECMSKQYGTNFDCEWLKDQFDHLRNTYLDVESLRGLPGFQWRKKRVQADPATWKRLLQANPDKRDDYAPLRQKQKLKWYPLVKQVFKGIPLPHRWVEFPADAKPPNKPLEPAGWDVHVQPPASTSPDQLQDSPTSALGDSNLIDHAEPGARHDTSFIPTSAMLPGQEGLSRPITTAALKKKKDDFIQLNPKRKIYLLQTLLQQRRLGFLTDDGKFQARVWARVNECMNKQYGANFDCEWLKDQFDHLRNAYLDVESLRDIPGFQWRKSRLQADPATWERLLEANPDKRDDYALLRQEHHPLKWYYLAEQVFKGTPLPNRRVEFPVDVKPQSNHLEPAGWDVHVQPPASTSIDQLQDSPTSAQGDCNPTDLSHSGHHPDTCTVPTGGTVQGAEGVSCAITNAITVMAQMFLDQVEPLEYVDFIQVVEKQSNAVVFLALASTTNPTICKTWLLQKIRQSHFP